tara:strand:+ start:1157 stop:1852 length:696 start_codon:yes stop_codon:yes gene_type:complete
LHKILITFFIASHSFASNVLLSQDYILKTPSRDGIGKFYQGREISKIMGHFGAAWLERQSRSKEENPKLAVDLLDLNKSLVVADFGAGTGYFTSQLTKRCSLVYAVDIQSEMIQLNKKNMLLKNIQNVKYVINTPKQTNLPQNSVDLILLVDVYHELEFPFEVVNDMKNSLKNNGQIVLLEYRAEDPSVPIKALHKMSLKQITREMDYVGMKLSKNIQELPRQHMLVFSKL